MSTERTSESDKEQWQDLATAPGVVPEEVSAMDFVAWIDGRMSEEEAVRMEAAVAADPVARQAAIDLADILGKPLPASLPHAVVRAQALVGFAAERTPASTRGWLSDLFPAGPGLVLQRMAMAASVLAIAAGGFAMGDLSGAIMKERYITPGPTEMISEVYRFFAFGRST